MLNRDAYSLRFPELEKTLVNEEDDDDESPRSPFKLTVALKPEITLVADMAYHSPVKVAGAYDALLSHCDGFILNHTRLDRHYYTAHSNDARWSVALNCV
jgi:hypothetical protein